MRYFTYLFFVLVFFNQLSAQSDTLNYQTGEVIISATKTATSAIEVASSVTVLNNKQIEQSQKTSLVDILRYSSGISIAQQGGTGRNAALFMRGAASNHTLVLVDGIKVNDPSTIGNTFNFANLQPEDISKVEILKGPQSTLYGSEAIAGIVNVFTKKGISEKPSFNFNVEGGSYNFYKSAASLSGKYNRINYFINFSKQKTDGISSIKVDNNEAEEDSYENTYASARLGYEINKDVDFELHYKFGDSKAEIDRASKNGDDPNYNIDAEDHLSRAQLNFRLFDRLESKAGISYFRRISHSNNLPDEINSASSYTFNFGKRIKYDFQSSFTVSENHKFTFGAESEKEEATTEFKSVSSFGPFESVFPEQSTRTTGLFIQDQIKYFGSFFATVGFRYDDHEKFGSQTTFRIAPAYFISKSGTKLKATYGTGFKSPSLFDLLDPTFGNPDLKPEKSKGWDAGIEQFLLNGKLRIEATYFNIEFEDMIGFDQNFVNINIDEVETKGVELDFYFNPLQPLVINANYTFTEAIEKTKNGVESNRPLLRRPKHKINFSANYSFNKFNLNGSVRFIGEREDEDFSTFPSQRVTLESYTIFDVAFSYDVYKYITLQARMENIFDEEYEDVLFYGNLGRSVYGGIKVNL